MRRGVVYLKVGKLPPNILEKYVLNKTGFKRPEVLVHPAIGEDCSIIGFGEHCCVLSSDPITGSGSSIGALAVHISCNDIAASGVEPLGILVTILAPEDSTEEDIIGLMEEINTAACEINVQVLGGHTEVTKAVNKMIVSTTAVGKGPVDGYVTSSGAQDGDDIIVTKYIGLEGTSIIAGDYEEYLKGKVPQEAIEKAKGYIKMISVVKEGIIGGRLGATSMHDATEGGLLGALWEIAEASGKGFEVYRELVPMTEETAKICQAVDINPLGLISSGMMVMTAKDSRPIIRALTGEGINAVCIGKIAADRTRRVLIDQGIEEEVTPPGADELFNIKIE